MKIVLLIALMFTLALVHGQNSRPCLPNWNNNAFNNFFYRHILHQDFNRGSMQAWRTYLQQNNLCHRRRQTFMEKNDQGRVLQICQGSGFRYSFYSNLCISNSRIKVYDLTVDNNCHIQTFNSGTRFVVVACDAINNVCRPVHFERSTNSVPNMLSERCQNGEESVFHHSDVFRLLLAPRSKR